jgi:choline dehydrogenase-like flavoprotein
MMLIDAQGLSAQTVIETDICIIGAGPAGITLAREFKNQQVRVCLLESGPPTRNRSIQKLNNGEIVGDPYANPRHTRRRQFGGTANRWCIQMNATTIGVRHAVLDKIDFEARDWVPGSGWPFDKAYLTRYYERGHTALKLGPFDYQPGQWEDENHRPLPLPEETVATTMFQFAPASVFTSDYDDVTQRAENITAIFNATVLEIETDDSGTAATGVRVTSPASNEFRVRAKEIIVAGGGIENARLLLLSNTVHKNGLGNQHDLVGRYFMDHAQSVLGVLIPRDRTVFDKMNLYDLRPMGHYSVMAKLQLNQELMRREKLLGISFILYPRRREHMTQAYQEFKTVVESIQNYHPPSQPVKRLLKMLPGTKDLLSAGWWWATRRGYYTDLSAGGWSRVPDKARHFSLIEVISQIEQSPDPDNRVTLGDGLDMFGQRQARIHWRLNELDNDSVRRSREILQAALRSAGIGELQIPAETYNVSSSHHHIGTTRMHDDARHGVVDRDCKVHGLANVFVAGSSVFPTGGYANPTLTIVALAIRLADHLKQRLAGEQAVTVGKAEAA